MWQAITGTIADPVQRRICAALGGDELIKRQKIKTHTHIEKGVKTSNLSNIFTEQTRFISMINDHNTNILLSYQRKKCFRYMFPNTDDFRKLSFNFAVELIVGNVAAILASGGLVNCFEYIVPNNQRIGPKSNRFNFPTMYNYASTCLKYSNVQWLSQKFITENCHKPINSHLKLFTSIHTLLYQVISFARQFVTLKDHRMDYYV